jgi:uncharacterized protein involved in exopolysaccharide biosynthesis
MAQTTDHPANQADMRQPAYPEDDEINLMDLLLVIARHNRFILKLTLGVALLAAVVTLILPNIYTGKTVILPPQQQSSSASLLLGQLGGVAGAVGGELGLKNPSDRYVEMLKSETVADQLIQQFHLQTLFHAKLLTQARAQLEGASSITADKDGFITVEFSSKDPGLAAAIANAYVDSLSRLTKTFSITEAGQRRAFFEKQLKITSDDLGAAELALKNIQSKTGVIQPDMQGGLSIGVVANLRAQIATQEVNLATMRSFATERNPAYMKEEQMLAGLKAQLAKAEHGDVSGDGDVLVPTDKVPSVSLEVMHKLRDVKLQQVLFDVLTKQYEIAKLDEAQEAGSIQVLDKALVPEIKSKPKRSLIVLLSALMAFFVGIVWAFIQESAERAQLDPAQAERMQLLRRYLSGHSK